MVGQILNDTYLIEERIGSGGMGDVYRATHQKLQSPVALKVVRRELLADPAMIQRFEHEARAASRLRHPNVVSVTDLGWSENGTLFMVMEYVRGKSLARVIADDAPLSAGRAIHIGAQILAALSVAHANNILHRDLKPENIMIELRDDAIDSVKVLDFGIAKLLARDEGSSTLTQAGLVCGTPGYMSPEQLQGGDLDARSDLFSAGVVLYEMLTRRLPHVQAPLEMLHRHLCEPFPPLRTRIGQSIPPLLERAVMQALSAARGARPASAAAMREQLLEAAITLTPTGNVEQATATEILPPGNPRRSTGARRRGTPPWPRRTPADVRPPSALEDGRAAARPHRSGSRDGARRSATPTGRASTFDRAVLQRIEERIAPLLGPVTPQLVSKISRHAATLDALCREVAEFIPSAEDRQRFLASSSAELNASTLRERRRTPPPGATPAPPWDPGVLDRAVRDLAVHLGPLARLIVRRASARARSPQELYELLALEIPSEADRGVFRRQAPPATSDY
ncbi:MAG TPA: protein kinase [Anaeromyxobacteraceae bacterium]|nr:protein kinase [Anaeromyxobacteraceae bacterium]